MSSLHLNISLLGFPGSGKSTQAHLLSENAGLAHIDVGATLRQGTKEDTDLGRRIDEIINQHKELVSDEVIRQVLVGEIGKVPNTQGIILDGAPRRKSQIDEVESALRSFDRNLDGVVFLSLPEEESVRRIAVRYACSQCARPYVLGKDVTDPTESCVACGGRLVQREDDTPEGVRKRLAVFARETLPVIEHYRSLGKLVEVDATLSVEESYRKIMEGLTDMTSVL